MRALLQGQSQKSTVRTDVIAAHALFPLIIEGADLHKDTMDVLQCEALIKALSLAPPGDVGNIRICIDYMQSFPASANIKSDNRCFVFEYGCNFIMSMPEGDLISSIMQAAICFEVENCQILFRMPTASVVR